MSAPKTLFQKIADKEIPAKLIHEDAVCVAFHDISPKAPTHVLIVPRKPIPRVAAATAEDQATLGHGLANGFRIVINNGPDGGESVPHLHVHLLGGRALDWPPG
ncbi:MAG: histidine triad nucleotide-binding protein [Opitutia bacterium AMD-G1]|nr:MAG: histidine triad nucleotide-binding protein [Opitutae bacterium AMD-G1]